MDFTFLADRKEAIPTVAGWYFNQWGHRSGKQSIGEVCLNLKDYLNRDKIPLAILAVEGNELMGVAQLKIREMDIYPDKIYWVGGVFVPSEQRGKGVATLMVQKVTDIAQSMGVIVVHLQTKKLDGGLYTRLGWKPVEQVWYRGRDVLVMEKSLSL